MAIVLYRSYMLSTPDYLAPTEQETLQKTAIQVCKTAAANITTTMNALAAENMIETSPTTLATPIMMAMQIHYYKFAKSEGLSSTIMP